MSNIINHFTSGLSSLALCSAIFFGITIPSEKIEAGNHEHRYDTDSRLSGLSLEHQLWILVQNRDVDALAELISPSFLGGNKAGFHSYDEAVAGFSKLSIKKFFIKNVVESQGKDMRTVAYDFSTKGHFSTTDHRISVWRRIKHKHHQYYWRLVSHSIFTNNG